MQGVRTYEQYFSIDKAYYPVINPESVKDTELKWNRTYPHKGFIDFLKAVVRMINRENNNAKNDLLVHGAFGTGKSRFIWTLSNLFKCTDKEFEDYFQSYELLKNEKELKSRFARIRSEKILTVFKYSSGEINTVQDFVVAVYEGIAKELVRNGYNSIAEKTVRGSVADRITEPKWKNFFEECFKQPKYRGLGSVYGRSVEEVADRLRNTNRNVENLLRDLFKIASDEKIIIYETTVEFLKEWIKEVIEVNNLSHIVFMWDEFSSMFKKMKDVLDSLQALQELHDSKPFNFIVATHESYNKSSDGSAVFDRFNKIEVAMPDVVAFDLIHDAIKPTDMPSLKTEYSDLIKDITEYTYKPRKIVCEKAKINTETMKNILPIHPMAALMLKYISVEFASNQRSMFNFIKNDDEDLHAFQWFIKNRSPENGDILTIDYLWDFFYVSGTDENSNATGKNNLSRTIASILDIYTINKDRMDSEEESRVLKTVLMMQAISRKQKNAVELLRPTVRNIQLAFEGDISLESDKAINILENLLIGKKKILYRDDSGKVPEYAANIESGDQSKIDEIKENLRKNIKTSQLVSNGELLTAFNFGDYLKARFDFTNFATVDNVRTEVSKVANHNNRFKIKTVICFARNEDEQRRLREKIDELKKEEDYKDILFIDATSSILGTDEFDMWLNASAMEENFRKPDPSLADNKQREAKEVLIGWKNKVKSGHFALIKGANFRRGCSSLELLKTALSEYVLSLYPLTLDNAKVSQTFFTQPKFPDGAKKGIVVETKGIYTKDAIENLLGKVRNVERYWEIYPDNSISRLKMMVDKLINEKLKKERRIAISEVIETLIGKGFIPCNLYAYLTGFLLKEYSAEPYRYSEGVQGDNGGMMSPEKLGNMIGEYYRYIFSGGSRGYKEEFIEIISDEQLAFIRFLENTFDIKAYVVEKAATRLRTYYKNNISFPIWCLKTIMDKDLEEPLDIIAEIMYTESEQTVPSLATKLGTILMNDTNKADRLALLLTHENGGKAMMEFLKTFENGMLLEYARKIEVKNILEDILKHIISDAKSYLFDRNEGEEQLRKLLIDYKIIYETNVIFSTKVSSVNSMYSDYKKYARTLKLPLSVLQEHCRNLDVFLTGLYEITKNSILSDDKKESFLFELLDKKENIRDFSTTIEEIYKTQYSDYVEGLDDNEIKSVISKMPQDIFMGTVNHFLTKLKENTDAKKQAQIITKLKTLWKTLTNSESPSNWSKIHKMPIKIMLEDSEIRETECLFQAFNTHNKDNKIISQAVAYLETNPKFIRRLNRTDEQDNAFRSKILDRYAVIFRDMTTTAIKNYLADNCTVEPHNWYGSVNIQRQVKTLAETRYREEVSMGVMDRIDDMNPQEAKEYLKNLAQNDVEVGISIITKKGGT